jgi:flavin reductase (DIM6/NTAB) family NADH-FMN oxidoreductase RutF
MTSNADDASSEWSSFDPKDLGAGGTYGLGISAVVPRPIALITSLNSLDTNDQVLNCAPFSYTGLMSHDPPLLSHGIVIQNGGKKDTLRNIEDTKQYVCHMISEDWLSQANACSQAVDASVSEVDLANLSTLPSKYIQVPRIEQAKLAMECVLESTKEVYNDDGKHTTTIVTGRIVNYHVHESVLKFKDGNPKKPLVDLESMNFCGRAGGITYWPTGEGKAVPMKRP